MHAQTGGEAVGPTTALPSPGLMDRLAVWIGRHWLLVVGLWVSVFLGFAVAAPVLAASGHRGAATFLYAVYSPFCHQLPQRSWFIAGRQAAYTWPEIQPATGLPLSMPQAAFHHPVDDLVFGWQLALCQRDMAIFTGFWLAMALYGIRRRLGSLVAPLPLRYYLVALIPIAADGLTQLVGWRESTPLLRTLTGLLFGGASALLVLPLAAEAVAEAVGQVGGTSAGLKF